MRPAAEPENHLQERRRFGKRCCNGQASGAGRIGRAGNSLVRPWLSAHGPGLGRCSDGVQGRDGISRRCCFFSSPSLPFSQSHLYTRLRPRAMAHWTGGKGDCLNAREVLLAAG